MLYEVITGLPHAGAAEQPDLPPLGVRSQQVDDLDPGLENLDIGRLVLERRGMPVNRSYNFV